MHVTFVSTKKNFDPSERELYEMDLVLRLTGRKRAFADLGLLTVAACTPPDVRVRFVDEYLEPIDFDAKTDLVALSAKTSCAPYAYSVAEQFRRRGVPVVMGGVHASLRPEEALEHVDCVVTGEAEALWPRVVADARAGRLRERYDAEGFPDMAAIPDPAWRKVGPKEGLSARSYLFQQVQTTRGCPFQCRFCSVPDISGQSFRFKPVHNVVRELAAFPGDRRSRRQPLYVVDDNFISRLTYTRELLQALVPLFRAGRLAPWSAETTLNVAQDEGLLRLFREAGCNTLIIGFESVSEATLRDMDKGINFCLTYPDAVARIHAAGLEVVGNFIVGFDTDDLTVFRDTLDFVQRTGILFPFFSILNPMPGTALFDEVRDAGRLLHQRWDCYDTRHVVHQPAQMRPDELMDGYIWLYEQAYGGPKVWERLEGAWRRRIRRGASRVEAAALGALLAPELLRGDAELRGFFRDGLRLLAEPRLHSDSGQLVLMLDDYDFVRSMRRHRSPRWAENVATFERGGRAPAAMQWDNAQARRRSGRG